MEALEVIASTSDAAFASNARGVIVLWNESANRLLGYSAGDVLGRSCFRVIRGFDIFGNLYCRSDCNLRRLLRCENAVCPFQMQVRKASGEYILANFRIVPVSDQDLSNYQVVHLIKQIDAAPEAVPKNYLNADVPDSPVEVASQNRESISHSPNFPLTNRESEVLGLLASGSSTIEISQKLHISVTTVRNHVQRILRKLAVHSKLEAVFVAQRNHLI